MTSEHTFAAAPWEAQEEHGKYVVRSPGHGLIADVFPWRTAEANARLIAAAPELLAALKVCYEFTPFHTADCDGVTEYEEGSIFDNTKGCTCYLSKAAAAIAKALGQPQ